MNRIATIALIAAALAVAPSACGGGGQTTPQATAPAAPPAAPQRPIVGIGEQQAAMFKDRRFAALGITHVRLVAAYDAMRVRFERDLVDVWIAEARRTGAEPFITLGHSRVKPRRLPSVAEYLAAFRAFRKRYPDVTVYAPWNEINHASQPTARAPR
ncbi:MAG: hypothetical protein ACRDMZ_08405, partial [Solirubrobacteraceae bacterium]